MDYRKTAVEILNAVGGSENVASAAHCATRLRLVIVDDKKVDKKTLENADGVKGVFQAQGQLQIILGTGTVNKVYAEFVAQSGTAAVSKDEAKAQGAKKGNWFQRAIKTLGDIFVPIIPAIVASGFLMGIMEAFILHIGKNIGLYFFFLRHGCHVGIVYVPGCCQEAMSLAVQTVYLLQKVFYLKNIISRPPHIYYSHRTGVSCLPGQVPADQLLVTAVAAADILPVFNEKLPDNFLVFRSEKLFRLYSVIRQIFF